MKIEAHPLGTLVQSNDFQILFGKRESQITELEKNFPSIKFKRIRQTHSDKIIHSSPHSIDFSTEADAHYTNEKDLGLCISTADCIPVMLFHTHPAWAVAIHAGWRGIEKRIVPKAISQILRNGAKVEDLHIFVGPHIQKISFEVKYDVRDLLLKSVQKSTPEMSQEISPEKSLVDLNLILKHQLQESGLLLENMFFEFKDTVADTQYHSFRRDKESSGRQLSFIVLR